MCSFKGIGLLIFKSMYWEMAMKYASGLVGALMLSLSVCGANAATITFDDAVGGNPAGTYTEAGYLFTPNSATNDVKCFDAGCLKEFRQGEITIMTKDGGGVFDLLGFYFALIGNGTATQGVQDITVTGLFEDLSTISRTFSLNALLSSFIDTTVVGSDDPAATAILKNDGYFVTIANGLFNNVLQVDWTTNSEDFLAARVVQSASARLDNVSVADPSPVPLPAAAWMLLAGLAAMGFVQRRKALV